MNIDFEVEKITRRISNESEPGRMSRQEALEYYEGIAAWIDESIGNLRDDLAVEEKPHQAISAEL